MEIIIELSFAINFIINAFIIRLTGLFLKEKARLWWLSSTIGAVIAIILPLFHLMPIFTVLIEILLASLLVSISFSFNYLCLFYRNNLYFWWRVLCIQRGVWTNFFILCSFSCKRHRYYCDSCP